MAHFSCRRPQVVAGDNLGALTGQLGCRESAKGVDAGQPGLLAATLLSFSLSFDDYVISSFTAGETVTLPLYLAGAFQREISPQIQVLSSLVLLVSAVLLVLASPPRQRRH